MLSDLVDLVRFALDVVTYFKAKSGGCKALYRLYCSLESVIRESELLLVHYLPLSLDNDALVGTTRFRSPLDKWVTITNQDFENLDRATKNFLTDFSALRSFIEIYDQELVARLEFHLGLKSAWARDFYELYCSGRVEGDGKKIKRTIFRLVDRIDEHLSRRLYADRTRYHSLYEELRDQLIVTESLDISIRPNKTRLILAGKANLEEIRKLHRKLADLIRQNCRLEDLLELDRSWYRSR